MIYRLNFSAWLILRIYPYGYESYPFVVNNEDYINKFLTCGTQEFLHL